MKKLIEADKVERITWEEPKHLHPKHVLTEVREKVRALPEIEAEPVRRGFWKYGENRFGIPNWECSACGCHGRGDYNYCPWCGAKMYEG